MHPGLLWWEDGLDADEVPFDVAVLTAEGLDAYPRSQAVRVPVDEPSELIEFTVTRDRASANSAQESEIGQAEIEISSQPQTSQRTLPDSSILVDVSQASRSLQLLELRVPRPL
jgi:hypothetical protein